MAEELTTEVSIKILLVDDEINITKSLRRLLMEYEQYEILTAISGDQALEIIREEPDIGILISDQRMPGMTGVELLSKARELIPDAVRILLTGYADITASIEAINEGAVFRYLTKPWKDEDLVLAVTEAARGYWLVCENRRLNELVAKQNEELQSWNSRLKHRVLDQTSRIRDKSDALAESNKQLRTSFEGTIEALAGLMETRNHSARGHSRNVAELVSAMASKLGLPEEEQKLIRSAGLLHDIGKIALPDQLLNQVAADLSGPQLKTYQSHAVCGQAAIDMVPELRDIGVLIRHHHEYYNGNGFPDRLFAEKIPLGSRLICAADMFERIFIKYPEPDSLKHTFTEMAKHWGKMLDPSLRSTLEKSAQEIYGKLKIASNFFETKIAPEQLKDGMVLCEDLCSGTGVLMLKRGTIFDETAISAVKRCQNIDPFEKEILVSIEKGEDQTEFSA